MSVRRATLLGGLIVALDALLMVEFGAGPAVSAFYVRRGNLELAAYAYVAWFLVTTGAVRTAAGHGVSLPRVAARRLGIGVGVAAVSFPVDLLVHVAGEPLLPVLLEVLLAILLDAALTVHALPASSRRRSAA